MLDRRGRRDGLVDVDAAGQVELVADGNDPGVGEPAEGALDASCTELRRGGELGDVRGPVLVDGGRDRDEVLVGDAAGGEEAVQAEVGVLEE